MDNETTSAPASQPSKMNPMIIVAIVVVLAIAAFFVMKSQNKGAAMTKTTEETTTTEDQKMAPSEAASPSGAMMDDQKGDAMTTDKGDAMKASEVTIEAGSFYYKPATLTAKVGQKVTIKFVSKDMMHDFNIDELNVHAEKVKGGETNTFEFTPTKAGKFEYYCSVGQHRANGQIGTITVTE